MTGAAFSRLSRQPKNFEEISLIKEVAGPAPCKVDEQRDWQGKFSEAKRYRGGCIVLIDATEGTGQLAITVNISA